LHGSRRAAVLQVGIAFYALDERLNHARGIWHLFVLAGGASHFVAVLTYVV
jgi:hemolysin III